MLLVSIVTVRIVEVEVDVKWMCCCIPQHVADVSDSADLNGFVLSNENDVSQFSDGCFLTPQCHKFVYTFLGDRYK